MTMSSRTTVADVSFICRVCQDPKRPVSPCSVCQTAFYCGRACKRLDQEAHATFCNKRESLNLEVVRRNLCLEIIKGGGEALSLKALLIERSLLPNKIFVFISHFNQVDYFRPFAFEEMERCGMLSDHQKYEELQYELDREEKHSRLIVLHALSDKDARVYILQKKDMPALKQSVALMPIELINQVFEELFNELTADQDSQSGKNLKKMVEHTIQSKKKPTDVGGFFDTFKEFKYNS